MGTVHDLLEARGKQAALEAGYDRAEVEAAAIYMADEDGGLGFVFSGWTQCALPHRRLRDDQPWQIATERVRLVVEPGRRPVGNTGDLEHVGVPFGAHARLILLYLQTRVLLNGSREVELGKSLREWMGRMGVPIGGSQARSVRDQAERISRCRLTFHFGDSSRGGSGLVNANIVDRALFIEANDSSQERLCLETAKISEAFYEQLKKHPVPLEEAAIKALANNSAAMDIYLWLAYRLHVLAADRPVSWAALKAQFGSNYKAMYHFKPEFLKALKLAMSVYPAARMTVTDAGVIMHPSPPPVAPKLLAIR